MKYIKQNITSPNKIFYFSTIFLIIIFSLNFFEKKNYEIVFEQSNLKSDSKAQNFKHQTLTFQKNDEKKVKKLFIEFKGNLHDTTAHYPDKIKIIYNDKIVKNVDNNFSLISGYYETSFKNQLDVSKLEIKFEGKYFEISKILLLNEFSSKKINLIQKIFDDNSIFELSYIFISLIICLYFFFLFFLTDLFFKKFRKDYLLNIISFFPIFIILIIILNLSNLFFQNFIIYVNFIFLLIFIFNLDKFKFFLFRNIYFFLFLFTIFLISQIPIIFRDFSFNYFGVVKSLNYSDITLMAKNDNFLGYHYDSNLIWIISIIFQNVETFNNVKEIFDQNSLRIESITHRPLIIHNFFSYFFELFGSSSHFFYVRLQYFILSLTFIILYKFCTDKLENHFSILIILCLIFSPSIYFSAFQLEYINKLYCFIFFIISFYFFEKSKFNFSLFLIFFGSLIHITGMYYSVIYFLLFFIFKNYDYKILIKYFVLLLLVFYFHFNNHIWNANLFGTQISESIYTSKLIPEFFEIGNFLKIKLLNLSNCFIPFFSELELKSQKVAFNKTFFYSILTLYFFFLYKFPKETFFNFFIIRLFVISPIILYIITLNTFSNGGYTFFYIFSSFFTLFYFFKLNKNYNNFFKFIIVFLFLFQAYENMSYFYDQVFAFNSKENYLFYIIFIILYSTIILYFLKLVKNIKNLNQIKNDF